MNVPARIATALSLGLSLLVSGPAAAAQPVEGVWHSDTGESRYRVSLCGDGTQLCAELVWLSDDFHTPQHLPYMNTMLVDGARLARPNEWKGKVHVYGDVLNGGIKLLSAEKMALSGCKFIFCKTFYLTKVE